MFWILAIGGKWTHFQNSTPHCPLVGKTFIGGVSREIGGRRATCRDNTVSSVIWILILSGLNSEHHLVLSS